MRRQIFIRFLSKIKSEKTKTKCHDMVIKVNIYKQAKSDYLKKKLHKNLANIALGTLVPLQTFISFGTYTS